MIPGSGRTEKAGSTEEQYVAEKPKDSQCTDFIQNLHDIFKKG